MPVQITTGLAANIPSPKSNEELNIWVIVISMTCLVSIVAALTYIVKKITKEYISKNNESMLYGFETIKDQIAQLVKSNQEANKIITKAINDNINQIYSIFANTVDMFREKSAYISLTCDMARNVFKTYMVSHCHDKVEYAVAIKKERPNISIEEALCILSLKYKDITSLERHEMIKMQYPGGLLGDILATVLDEINWENFMNVSVKPVIIRYWNSDIESLRQNLYSSLWAVASSLLEEVNKRSKLHFQNINGYEFFTDKEEEYESR